VAIVDGGGRIIQETRSFDPDTGKTHSLRSKEDAHDYRYFSEPDLPPLVVTSEEIETERANVPTLPAELRKRYVVEYGLSPQAAATIASHPAIVRFFDEARAVFPQPLKVANFMLTEVMRGATLHGSSARFSVSASQIGELLRLVDAGEISGKQAKEVFAALEGTEKSPKAIIEERGLRVVNDTGAVESLCAKVIADNAGQVAQYRSGKTTVFGFFVGQVMKQSRGSADPKLVNEVLKKLLEQG
jgi:aspartyl-tRNA(Asn)/glutamyl-tRNA(Gln) amidotransferase subunit B